MTEKVSKKNHTLPESKWKFDDDVSRVFENMLQRSIPQYEVMRQSVADIVCKFFKNGDIILDLGCSDGGSIKELFDRLGARASKFVGVDISEPMIEKAQERFKGYNLVQIERVDLRYSFPEYYCGIIQAILCLCFIPIEYRQRVVSNCYKSLRDGGAFVIVEKMLGETAELDEVFVDRYLHMKAQHGYTQEEIIRKQLSLEGVLVPITASWLQSLLKNAGFSYVDCFWRWMNFAGWVAIK